MKCPPIHIFLATCDMSWSVPPFTFLFFGDWIFFMATILQLKVAKRQAWRRAWSAVGALLCYMHFIQVTNPFISWFLLFFFPTEQLAPTKEAILQIESNEFVPQSFSSSAGSKDNQVTKIPFNLFNKNYFELRRLYGRLFGSRQGYGLPSSKCFTVSHILTVLLSQHSL